MKYISTRGGCPPQNFEQVLLSGLAPDGGLFIPQTLPTFSAEQIEAMKSLQYADLALEIVTSFVDGEIPTSQLKKVIDESYVAFKHPEVAPLTRLSEHEYLLELYHGPTLAFKDFALQVLGRLLDHVLRKNDQRVVILGATSGDTGSAALEGCRHSERVEMYILHPYQRVSAVQRKQMTTVPGDNVFNLAIEGNFDDCQRIVKAAFANQAFLPSNKSLVAVNSINWVRILMQIVYYFYAALKLGAPNKKVSFSVPTGNFGDIYAGYLARRMGLPIDRLIVATNKNDILHRFISRNEYSTTELSKTFSPSMDILVSSNFERYLYDLLGKDSPALCKFMDRFGKETLSVSAEQWAQMKSCFDSSSVDDATTCQLISELFTKNSILVDPHTAVGVKSGRDCSENTTSPIVTLATAHPAKFSDAISAAGLKEPNLPEHLGDLFDREERYSVLPNSLSSVTEFIQKHS
ncbi:MAG: threonine synthase [Gammaproteobacteria bacterium]|nr:threonine synthase [Gammaproteobacteria bacterium]OUV76884.1 MAG: threonine synthase [Gammaproteobacteria bacterium TMED139]